MPEAAGLKSRVMLCLVEKLRQSIRTHGLFLTLFLARLTGDVVVIPADGFYEPGIKQGDIFGIDRMMEVVRTNRHRPAKDIVLAMYHASRDHTSNMAQEDDMAAIVIKAI